MKNPLFNMLSGLAVLGILLVAGLLAAGTGDRGQAQVGQPVLVGTAEGAGLDAAETALAPQRKPRRVRASLSMPYFSFAQSLRPGG